VKMRHMAIVLTLPYNGESVQIATKLKDSFDCRASPK